MDIPVLVIVGSTGTGKSKLAIEIAQKFNGEIISADSMQVYKGLDIISNKVTAEERQLIPHHVIDFVNPLSRFTVVDFRNKALQIIDDILEKQKLPVIVGGTNYYIESILWRVLIENADTNDETLLFDRDPQNCLLFDDDDDITKETIFANVINADSFKDISSDKLHKVLNEIDSDSALRLHPNDKRKIIRCLQVYQQKGQINSEILSEQRSLDGGCSLGGPLRYKNSCILWLQCDQKVLNERLDKRVDQMVDQGLVQELLDFHHNYNKQRLKDNVKADYCKGIFQSIGFKEFHDYLILSDDERQKSEKILNKSVNDLKVATKRYAKKQIKWIKNRFLMDNDRLVPNIYSLDATDLQKWNQNVIDPSIAIINYYLNGDPLPHDLTPMPKFTKTITNEAANFYCDICERNIWGTYYWSEHLRSRSHNKTLKSKYKQKEKYHQLITILEFHENNLKKKSSN